MNNYLTYRNNAQYPFNQIINGKVHYSCTTIQQALKELSYFEEPIEPLTKQSVMDRVNHLYNNSSGIKIYKFNTVDDLKANYPELFI